MQDVAAPAKPTKICPYSIASLVLGILSIVFCLGAITGIPAVICGHVAKAKIKAKAHLEGGGMALAGLILGYLAIVLTVIAVIGLGAVGVAAVPVMEKAQIEAGKYACINNLRQIEMAKEMWVIDNAMGPGDTPSAKDIESYIGTRVDDLECPAGGTYSINPIGELPTCSNPEHSLEALAWE